MESEEVERQAPERSPQPGEQPGADDPEDPEPAKPKPADEPPTPDRPPAPQEESLEPLPGLNGPRTVHVRVTRLPEDPSDAHLSSFAKELLVEELSHA